MKTIQEVMMEDVGPAAYEGTLYTFDDVVRIAEAYASQFRKPELDIDFIRRHGGLEAIGKRLDTEAKSDFDTWKEGMNDLWHGKKKRNEPYEVVERILRTQFPGLLIEVYPESNDEPPLMGVRIRDHNNHTLYEYNEAYGGHMVNDDSKLARQVYDMVESNIND